MTSIAMKVYDLEWFSYYGKDLARSAHALRSDGIDTVLTQNQIDPLPASGVMQGHSTDGYDDQKWMDALRAEGLTVLQTTATFFDPPTLARFPDARPINALGQPDTGFDWYTGVCPTDEDYLGWKIDRLSQVVDRLGPEGLFLQFTRWPGFWENWTWNPDYEFGGVDEYCFCDRCRRLFVEETGTSLQSTGLQAQASEILDRFRAEWVDWKCTWLHGVIDRIARESGCREQGLTIMLNTLPFPSDDFADADVRRTTGGQDLSMLDGDVDRFELMTYLQILNRPVSWIEQAVRDARNRTGATTELVCTLQVAPLYTSGIHRDRNRSGSVTADELEAAADVAFSAGADGLVFYHWGDFLDDEAEGGVKRQALRNIAQRFKELG